MMLLYVSKQYIGVHVRVILLGVNSNVLEYMLE